MANPTLKAALGTYPHTKALKEGQVKTEGFDLEFVEVNPIIAAFRRMIRNEEFDISEMALSTYLVARAHNKPITAIPVFPVRSFQHGGTVYNTKSGIEEPKDLAGKKVGLRAYTVTGAAWARGILQDEYGVDLSKINWVAMDDEHVGEYQAPPNVQRAPGGKTLEEMIVTGEIDAGIGLGRVESDDVKTLIPDARNAGIAHYKKTGVYPINHTVVIKNSVLQANPGVAEALFNAFKQSKAAAAPDEEQGKLRDALGSDPVPYGIEPNRKALETMIRYNVEQKLIPSAVKVEDLFAPSTVKLQ